MFESFLKILHVFISCKYSLFSWFWWGSFLATWCCSVHRSNLGKISIFSRTKLEGVSLPYSTPGLAYGYHCTKILHPEDSWVYEVSGDVYFVNVYWSHQATIGDISNQVHPRAMVLSVLGITACAGNLTFVWFGLIVGGSAKVHGIADLQAGSLCC